MEKAKLNYESRSWNFDKFKSDRMNIGNTSPANELEILRAWRLLNEQPKWNQTQNAVNKNIIYDLEQWPQKDTAHKIKRNVTFVPMIQPFRW